MSRPSTGQRHVVVTGGGRGIGRAIVENFLRSGDTVTVLQRTPPSQDLADLAATLGTALRHVSTDFSDRNSVEQACAQVLAGSRVDVLVNNAGTQERHAALDFPLADLERVMAVNFTSVFQLCQALGAPMVARGEGKIVNLASLLSFQGGLRVPAYAASKGAVAQLTKALCNEWAGHGVNVNAVAPGYVSTEMNAALEADSGRREQISARIPAGRWAEPEDIAGAVAFLASPQADYVHGVILPVDGGWMAR